MIALSGTPSVGEVVVEAPLLTNDAVKIRPSTAPQKACGSAQGED